MRAEELGKFRDAIRRLKQALELATKEMGANHRFTASLMNNLGLLYQKQSRYREAEYFIRRSLLIRQKVLGRHHSDVAQSLNTLGLLYRDQGRYSEAESVFQRSFAIIKEKLGAAHPYAALSLNNLAALYMDLGRYREAGALLQRSLTIRKNAQGLNNPEGARSLNNLAEFHRAEGRFRQAEGLMRRSLEIRRKILNPNHPDMAQSLNNLAGLYHDLGRADEAAKLYRTGLSLLQKSVGAAHPAVATIVNNLAELHREKGRNAKAAVLYERALAIRKKSFGPDHPAVANSLNNLAVFYDSQGRFAQAEALYRRSLRIWEAALGPNHPTVASGLNNLAELYRQRGRYGDALPLYQRSIEIRKMTLGSEHPDLAISFNNLAQLYFGQRDWAQAAVFWRRATDILTRHAARSGAFGKGTAVKHQSLAARNDWYFWGLVKAVYREHAGHFKGAAAVVDEMFQTAQWALGSQAARALAQMAERQAIGDSRLAKLVRERQDLVREWQARDKLRVAGYARAALQGNNKRSNNLPRLSKIDRRIAVIDRIFAKEFPDYVALVRTRPLSVAQVQDQLGADEALILFLTTKEAKPTPEETFIWVVTKTDAQWLRSPLGTAALTRDVGALRCGLDRDGSWEQARNTQRWTAKSQLCRKLWPQGLAPRQPLPFDVTRAHRLYKDLFGKIETLVSGKNLLIIPSGPLTTLPFHVLVTQSAGVSVKVKAGEGIEYRKISWLAGRHALTVLPSVSSLKSLRQFAKASRASEAFLGFGNPLLEGNPQQFALAKTKRNCPGTEPANKPGLFSRIKAAANFLGLFRGGTDLADVAMIRNQNALPETADELCAIARTVGAAPDTVYLANFATETELKTLSALGYLAKARIVQFATHGLLANEAIFLGKSKAEPGLILTPPQKATRRDDGFLTASEIATLELDADLVILSACNTAGGAGAANAEALSGLARAFFYSGARALLVTHWYVNSVAAVSLTTGTLSALKQSPDIGRSEALRRSMLALIGKGGGYAHPSYWAPFIVVGEGGARR